MTRKEEILAAYDDVLSHPWESLDSALKDVTGEQAEYQHAAYIDEPDELHYPKAGTILWHLVHLAHCYRHYAPAIKERPIRPPEPEAPEANTLEEAINNLLSYRKQLRDVIEATSDDGFEEKMGNGKTVAEFLRSVIRHDAWHAAQIVVVRRLYKTRGK